MSAPAKKSVAPKKHKHVLKDNLGAITEPAIKRMCHRAGVKRINNACYHEIRQWLRDDLELVIKTAIVVMQEDKRKTIMDRDIRKAFELNGVILAVGVNHDIKRAEEHKSAPKKQTADGSKHKFKAGTVALRDIKFQQKNSDTLLIPKAHFDRLMHELAQDWLDKDKDARISDEAKLLCQIGIESNMVTLLMKANLLAIHASNVTLFPRDIQTARNILTTPYLHQCN